MGGAAGSGHSVPLNEQLSTLRGGSSKSAGVKASSSRAVPALRARSRAGTTDGPKSLIRAIMVR